MSPPVMRATRSHHEAKGLQIEPGDTVAIIDGRQELKLIKGQNQRTFDIGIFPRNLLEQRKVGAVCDVAMRNSLGNGSSASPFGFCWGGAAAMANGDSRQAKGGSVAYHNHAKERKSTSSKQFAYNKLVNEAAAAGLQRRNAVKHKASLVGPQRPPPPQFQQEGLLIDISPSVGIIGERALETPPPPDGQLLLHSRRSHRCAHFRRQRRI